jgi:hypothetical protein
MKRKWIEHNGPEKEFEQAEVEETVNMQQPEGADAGGSAEIGRYGRLPLPPRRLQLRMQMK